MNYPESLSDFHLTAQLIDNIDAGVVMLDREYRVMTWNTFMKAYSGISADQIMGENIFEVIPDLPQEWLKNKIQSTFKLGTRSFSCWEDRPYIFHFINFSPVTGGMAAMYQNMTLTPLKALDGEYRHICLTITDVSDIARSKTHLRESNAQLTHLSITDKLTQLHNRGHWESCLSNEFDHCRHSQSVASLVMFDIDHFKKVNDTFGHVAGDAVIKSISSLLKKAKRQSDIAGRYGGEEFGVILPGTTAELAQYFTHRLRNRIQESLVKVDVRDIRVTISLGICEWASWMNSYEQWLECADSALYQSKRQGRNRCTLYQSTTEQCAAMRGIS
ncbi:sensor domain-containing diguanylate cyclase [Photobacterium lutimaris]|uniref:diguanylate cyclase n=1 Tax=Photobacterium lutimaris TaxID=388278 RepID=A0A2T3J0D1_9GAMM|nr:sensor domain-containing diguanylate cyclase [Photobacterium lutimaris]PSU34374.1 diguanylate cyclase [Photobacterium lutimaris]TDR75974.1 PAS domain S-box-containing protein/diguanylate cyclase (GGDEF)-like protein [Photobacterium lutimaris]